MKKPNMHFFRPATMCLATLLSTAAWGQTPTLSLWVTEVNGVRCASCPTQNLPADEVNAGDTLRVEAFVEGWDDNPDRGTCSGNPSQGFGQPCTIGSVGACAGKHCGNNGMPCMTNLNCPGSTCIPSTCLISPQIGAFQFAVDFGTFAGGSTGTLTPARIPCIASECVMLTDVDCPCCPCARLQPACTCASSVLPPGASCQVDGFCGPEGSAFIETARADFVLAGRTSILAVNTSTPSYDWGGLIINGGVIDAGLRQYLGTLLLKASPDASGTFTIRFLDDPARTFINDTFVRPISPRTLQPLFINVSGVCPDSPILSSNPPHCAIDARIPHALTDPNTVFGFDRISIRLGGCDATGLRSGAFHVDVIPGPAIPPVISDVTGVGDTATLIFDRPIPPRNWTCVTHIAGDERVCVGFLPGDVNGSRSTNAQDITALINSLNNVPGLVRPLYATDANRSGAANGQDITTLINILNGAAELDPWLNASLVPCPAP